MRVRFVEKDGSETWREIEHVSCDRYIVPAAAGYGGRLLEYQRVVTRHGPEDGDFTVHFEYAGES